MILVAASIADEDAASFVRTYKDAAVSLFTCFDIASNKSSLRYPQFNDSYITVGGKQISLHEIRGVVNVLPAIFPGELFFYPEEEREYQAAEFHALLTFFLSALQCPVINKPSSLSLSGPFINPMSWYHVAHEIGIPLSRMQIDSDDPPASAFDERGSVFESTCIGGSILSPSGTVADDYTQKLAAEVHCHFLKVFYTQEQPNQFSFIRAQTTPDLKEESVCAALMDFFD
ncbi:MAG: hypothetical protein Q8916_10505 [Bacteroidota bacterium]|nr:hypothetical protein [Bacteroidota bacterium]MDP4230819.1 hypothetical protein [Bacteroidota bacterium]MDP4236758.1 hypothetical protein [Bacteroidota bacterium]